jgi:hypothetical protein
VQTVAPAAISQLVSDCLASKDAKDAEERSKPSGGVPPVEKKLTDDAELKQLLRANNAA